MRIWINSLLWRFRPRRNVRMQLKDNQGAVDGILLGIHGLRYRRYALVNAWFYEQRPNAEGQELLGTTYLPVSEVLLYQEKDIAYGKLPWQAS